MIEIKSFSQTGLIAICYTICLPNISENYNIRGSYIFIIY